MIQSLSLIRQMIGSESYAAGEALAQKEHLRVITQSAAMTKYVVADSPVSQTVTITPGKAGCTCEEMSRFGVCRHLAAALLYAKKNGTLDELIRRQAVQASRCLMAAMDAALPQESPVRMQVNLTLQNPGSPEPRLRIGCRVGEDRLYVVRSIPQWIEAIQSGTSLDFGKGFTWRGDWVHLPPEQDRVLQVLIRLCLAQKNAGISLHNAEARQLLLPDPFAHDMLQVLEQLPFHLTIGEQTIAVRRIHTTKLPLLFRITTGMRSMAVTGSFPQQMIPLTADCSWVLVGSNVIRVEEQQRHLLLTMWQNQLNGRAMFEYPLKDAGRIIGEIVPYLRMQGAVDIDSALQRRIVQLPLQARVYLDRDGRDVLARTQFHYGETVIDPFHEDGQHTLSKGGKLLLRDGISEHRVLDTLGLAGFSLRQGTIRLTGQDQIFQFITEGVGKLQAISEVYLSNDFRKMTPRKPKLHVTARMSGGKLLLEFTDDGVPSSEILGILDALNRRARYFHLQDGSFLDLSEIDEWIPLAENITEAVTTDKSADAGGTIAVGSFRTAYLTGLMEALTDAASLDQSVRDIAGALLNTEEPAELPKLPGELSLRPYQQRGLHWMLTLDKLHMGGVLADEMGLGKTVQVISLLKSCHQPGQVSLVVAPTSLTYNWLSELNRFAPQMTAMVMSGTSAQRLSQLEHVRKAGDIDILITSYPLIRRDIDTMTDIPFRFVILDEAQQIKNAGSVGASAVKQLQAQTRFALTGTPMENGIGELWSIFDFVLPGYLLSYPAFLRRYQDGLDLDDLRRKLRPFLLRRLKKDVLTELPDKLENTYSASMTPQQEKVYRAAMLRLRDRVNHAFAEKGPGRSRTDVLAAITELRQICCHPSLVLQDYSGSSGKLETLLDILPGYVQSGRRILLFSQFTRMLRILQVKLREHGYTCMYLDGDTPPNARLEMTEQFNAGKAEVFLISLKAGGTGLNLTGADMVIHYDPWWNPAAEDQATDRAHRIGQTRKVEVVRLTTHGTIEEQVVAMGQQKKALFDQLITPGEELVTALSERELRALFD